jgi:hypothetical protein
MCMITTTQHGHLHDVRQAHPHVRRTRHLLWYVQSLHPSLQWMVVLVVETDALTTLDKILGPTRDVVAYFADLGFSCPQYTNPAEYISTARRLSPLSLARELTSLRALMLCSESGQDRQLHRDQGGGQGARQVPRERVPQAPRPARAHRPRGRRPGRRRRRGDRRPPIHVRRRRRRRHEQGGGRR